MKMSWNKVAIAFGLLALGVLCTKILFWGVIDLERNLNAYPLVSHETIKLIGEMEGALLTFDTACRRQQEAQHSLDSFDRDVCESETPQTYCSTGSSDDCIEWELEDMIEACSQRPQQWELTIQETQTGMADAVERRQELAAHADWGLVRTILTGTQNFTHANWSCVKPGSDFTTAVHLTFSPTY
jgi:hypothetical protein